MKVNNVLLFLLLKHVFALFFFSVTQLLFITIQILQNDLIDVSSLKALLMNNDFHAANVLLDEVLRHGPEHG